MSVRSVMMPSIPEMMMATMRPSQMGKPAVIRVAVMNTASVPMSPMAKFTVSVERKMITMPRASRAYADPLTIPDTMTAGRSPMDGPLCCLAADMRAYDRAGKITAGCLRSLRSDADRNPAISG